jgi:hypothetical protein
VKQPLALSARQYEVAAGTTGLVVFDYRAATRSAARAA